MKLSMFAVVHERPDASALLDDPLVHCHAGKQLVLAYVSRNALEDRLRVSGGSRITLPEWSLVVDRNLEAFKRIIEAKFERGEWQVHSAFGQSNPRLVVTEEDMRRSGDEFTIDVLNLDAGFRRRA
jgi:hypothetical protein